MKKIKLGIILICLTIALTSCGFHPGLLETKYDSSKADEIYKPFSEFVKKSDFSTFDYSQSIDEKKDRIDGNDTTEVDITGYKNLRHTVFAGNMDLSSFGLPKEPAFMVEAYFNAEDNLLQGNVHEYDEETSKTVYRKVQNLERKWSDFPFEENVSKSEKMLKYIINNNVECKKTFKYVSVTDFAPYIFKLTFENEPDENWKKEFGDITLRDIIVGTDETGSSFESITINWQEAENYYRTTWNSYQDILASENVIIDFEKLNGLREDGRPDWDKQVEELKKEIENNPYY